MEKNSVQIEIERRISKLDNKELSDLIGYLNHLDELRSLTSARQIAMNEIQTALKKGFTF